MNAPIRPPLESVLHPGDRNAFVAQLEGIYEHSPWVAEAAFEQAPFASLAHLKRALAEAVGRAGPDRQLELIRAHPELAGRAMVAGTLTAESTGEQQRAGLTHCTPEQFERLQQLNADYREKFGFPFIVAVRGPHGRGLSREQIIEVFERRLRSTPPQELAENLRNIHRIAEIRLNERFGAQPTRGARVLEWAEALARHTEAPDALTVTYATPAHRATADQLVAWMREAGFDQARIDPVGNVIGRYEADPSVASPRTLITGSHYDTVRNGGRYDGRLGILAPMAEVEQLHAQGRRLPFALEVIGFAEEEGARFRSTFLGSSAICGQFDTRVLDATDAEGITMREAMRAAGYSPDEVASCAHTRDDVIGHVEIHIEQGPVLLDRDLPLGVVTSINGSVRMLIEIDGVASHAGTTPMDMRHDAACAAAEFILAVERRAGAEPALVGTVGQLEVPAGSTNVVPGRCRLSLDVRAPEDGQRDRAVDDMLASLQEICARRGVQLRTEETLRAPAAPCDPSLKRLWAESVAALGVPVFELPSGAGHDAMMMARWCPQAMLFVRCGNGGISHNPLETMTDDDAELAVAAFDQYLNRLEPAPR